MFCFVFFHVNQSLLAQANFFENHVTIFMHILWRDLSSYSVTFHQMSFTESLACPCLPLTVSRSGKRMNWRNKSDSFEESFYSKMTYPQRYKALEVSAEKPSASCSWYALGFLKQYPWGQPTGPNKEQLGERRRTEQESWKQDLDFKWYAKKMDT